MKLTARSGRSPTVHELAQYMELSVEEVLEGLEASAAHHSTSLEVPRERPDGESGALADTLGVDDAELERVENRATVRAAIQTLSDRDQRVLGLRFFDDCTQAEIAEQIGVSQMQVSRILRRAIAHLHEHAQAAGEVRRNGQP
jgi:RNA polymerase sigma-B factor